MSQTKHRGARRTHSVLLFLLISIPVHAGNTPPLELFAGKCSALGFIKEICAPTTGWGAMIGIKDATFADGNTGSLWVTALGISFRSTLNDERFILHYEDITATYSDLTRTESKKRDKRFTTAEPQRNYFRITTKDRTYTFWTPGGISDTNDAARFYHEVLNAIVPIESSTIRKTE